MWSPLAWVVLSLLVGAIFLSTEEVRKIESNGAVDASASEAGP